jgi:uncharacterized FlaG/YvyC family protein
MASLLGGSRVASAAQNEPFECHHAWARFGVGSWKLVRVNTETLKGDADVESVSITETKTTLDEANEHGYTLKVEVTVEVAGKRFKSEPKYVTYGYNGELKGQTVSLKDVGTGEVVINGNKYETVAQRIEISGATAKSVSTVQYSQAAVPYFLRRTTEVTDSETMARNYRSVVEVVALHMPEKVLTKIKPASHVRTIETYAKGTRKITLEAHCEDVPGGVVSHTSKQLDAEGRVVQRSTLELVDYEIKAVSSKSTVPRRRFFKNRRRRSE